MHWLQFNVLGDDVVDGDLVNLLASKQNSEGPLGGMLQDLEFANSTFFPLLVIRIKPAQGETNLVKDTSFGKVFESEYVKLGRYDCRKNS